MALYRRMQAKLFAFLETPEQTYRRYPADDASVPARYAHAFAKYRQRNFDGAIAILDELLRERPGDPYFLETKGQMLLESGRPKQSVRYYEAAAKALPREPLLKIVLGQALVSSEDPGNLPRAIEVLRSATEMAPLEPSGWRWRALAHGRSNEIGMAALCTAENYLLRGRTRDAWRQAKRAAAKLPAGSPGNLRAQDLIQTAEDRITKRKRHRQ
jgi:predicted Zn-dependent protease